MQTQTKLTKRQQTTIIKRELRKKFNLTGKLSVRFDTGTASRWLIVEGEFDAEMQAKIDAFLHGCDWTGWSIGTYDSEMFGEDRLCINVERIRTQADIEAAKKAYFDRWCEKQRGKGVLSKITK